MARRSRGRLVALGTALVAAAAAVAFAGPAQAATLTEVTGFGSNPGNLKMFEYVPTGLAANRPLVVLLHGCSATAAQIDNETGWTKWADQFQFALVLPEQKPANNAARCWNAYVAGDQDRDQGEPLSIKQETDWAISHHGIDSSRVFVTGLSAGGAMTNVMLATYPDVYKAGGEMEGGPYKCASAAGAQTTACNAGTVVLTPQQWGDKVRAATSWTGPWPRVSVWHGTADTTVNYQNLVETVKQWTNVQGIDQTPDTSNTVAGYPHDVYKDASGNALVETYSITGMNHGWPIDPGTGALQCGVVGAYFNDVNICGSYYVAQWLGLTS
jgi:poly(hydroxyalkanoate) depolymerase family esterase